MKRGDLIIVSSQGNFGKPRPAVVVQSDALTAADSVLVSLLTTDMTEAPLYHLMVAPTNSNGLKQPSQDRSNTPDQVQPPVGSLDRSSMIALNHMLTVMFGIAD